MFSSLEKLQKIVSLEIKRKFDNKAVVGGLAMLLSSWPEDAQKENIDQQSIHLIVDLIEHYGTESIPNRSAAIDEILTILKNCSSDDLEPHSPQPIDKKQTKRSARIKQPDQRQQVLDSYAQILQSPVTTINGVGTSMAGKLALLGIQTISDLIHYYPRRYDDFSNLQPINRLDFGIDATLIGTVKSISSRPTRNPRITITEAVLSDGTGYIRLSWFNQKYLEKVLLPEMQIVVSGKVEQYLGRLTINNPEWEKLDKEQLHTNRIVPVYPLVAELKQRTLRNLIFKTISFWSSRIVDYFPEWIIRDAELLELSKAVKQIHFPDSIELLKSARQRIAFDEIFLLQLGAMQQKKLWQSGHAQSFRVTDEWVNEKIKRLPFELTGAQRRAINEIRSDLETDIPMNRLLQGDVGSGKTIVAAFASAITLAGNAQVAVLAPTSILAEQHFQTFQNLLSSQIDSASLKMIEPGSIRLLVGGTSQEERALILEGLKNNTVKCIIGTHALLEDPVTFHNLHLAIIDEQHRFGVKQRAVLRAKGDNLHLLVMTATPIPRSLALTIYGDLDLSLIDEMPPGRQVVGTHVLYPIERERAYSLIQAQIQSGHQAFIIYPLVEESEESSSKAAVTEFERLKANIFPNTSVGLVHGRLNQEEKDLVMQAFRNKEYDILVATTVIEVGVDIPNATVMLIEGANRFGLAQLHQLRGRVGRGKSKSYCLLIPETKDAVENERLVAMSSTNNGFILAEKDLAQRGPGEFLGVRQSGYSNLRIASLSDIKLIEKARNFAQLLFESDPDLAMAENQNIKSLIQIHWQDGQGDVS